MRNEAGVMARALRREMRREREREHPLAAELDHELKTHAGMPPTGKLFLEELLAAAPSLANVDPATMRDRDPSPPLPGVVTVDLEDPGLIESVADEMRAVMSSDGRRPITWHEAARIVFAAIRLHTIGAR